MLKSDGVIMMNERIMYPSDVVFDKAEYPEVEIKAMLEEYESYAVDATTVGTKLGNKMVANTIILGMLAKKLVIDKSIWEAVILERVPEKAKEINQKAFDYGYDFV